MLLVGLLQMRIIMNILRNKFKVTLLTICVLSGLAMNVSCDDSVGKAQLVVDISLVNESDGIFIITFRSNSINGLYLANWDVASSGVLSKDLLHILSTNGEPQSYKGKLVKRHEPAREDLIYISSKKSVSSKIKVDDFYQIDDGVGQIWYEAFIPIYQINGEELEIASFESIFSNKLTVK